MTLKQFFDIFKRRLREQSGTAVPVIEVIGGRKRIRVGTCRGYVCPMEFVAGVPWRKAGKVLGLDDKDYDTIIGAADGTGKDAPFTSTRKRLLKICNLSTPAVVR